MTDGKRRAGPLIGYGKSFASFGEVVQGRTSDNEDFLVTLPIDLWSTCEIVCSPIDGPLVVECELEKSRAVLYHVLAGLGITRGFHIACDFTRTVPIGKGLSSSTADMLATLRAIQEVFGFLFTEAYISRIFSEIEPHDGLHFNTSVIYNHRTGRLIDDLRHIPEFTIIAIDEGGEVDTVHYNRGLTFADHTARRFDTLLGRVRAAYADRNDAEIAACATESARIHADRTGNGLLAAVLDRFNDFGPLGLIATHSGTCAGMLYRRASDPREIEHRAETVRQTFGRSVFVVRTLQLLF